MFCFLTTVKTCCFFPARSFWQQIPAESSCVSTWEPDGQVQGRVKQQLPQSLALLELPPMVLPCDNGSWFQRCSIKDVWETSAFRSSEYRAPDHTTRLVAGSWICLDFSLIHPQGWTRMACIRHTGKYSTFCLLCWTFLTLYLCFFKRLKVNGFPFLIYFL